MRYMQIVLIVTVLALCNGEAQEAQKTEQSSIQILKAGWDEKEGPALHSGDTWWGLYPQGDGFELLETTVTLEDANDPCFGAHKTFKLSREGEPLFLVKGLKNPQAGPVQTVLSKYTRLAPSEEYHVHQLGWGNYDVLFALGNVIREGIYLVIKDYTINIREQQKQNGIVQEILHIDRALPNAEMQPAILWIGDLDRDGRLDIFLDATVYPSGHYILYLSSEAGKGEIVRKVAEMISPGC